MSGTTDNPVRVVVRFRPPLINENEDKNDHIAMDVNQGNVTVHGKNHADDRCFTFDRVYSPETPQEVMMEEVTPLIEHVLEGRHATLFAYGQTGGGKTYTIDGPLCARQGNSSKDMSRAGIIDRAIEYLFYRIREMESEDGKICYDLSCSYYQLYNERVTDLLKRASMRTAALSRSWMSALEPGLQIHCFDGNKFEVKDLIVMKCTTREQMHNAFVSGAREKTKRSNAINQQSSRSHSLFTIHVLRRHKGLNEVTKSEFTVVDLAGTEKLFMFNKNPSQTSLREAIEINTSLLALRKVISALASTAKKDKDFGALEKSVHIPYRDSKLTKLLKHALDGNSRTTMIACINMSNLFTDETVSTLLYAGAARRIVSAPQKAVVQRSSNVRHLLEENARLLKELEYYRYMAAGNLSCVSTILGLWGASDLNMRWKL